MTRISALALTALALVGVAPAGGGVGDLYALRYGAKMNLVVPYDPVRLVPSGRAIRTGPFAQSWSMSPYSSRLVLAAGRRVAGQPAALRFVDLERGRIDGTLSLPGEFGRIGATAWVGDRVLAVVWGSDATTVYAVDADERVVRGHVEIPGVVVAGERAGNGLVLLLAPGGQLGAATLAVVDRSLRVRTVELARITAGMSVKGEGDERRTALRRPALAVSHGSAFVFGAHEAAAAVDLRSLAVRYSPRRLPTRATKNAEGSVRTAAALPDGRVVVSGFDYGAERSGVWLVDPKDWSSRLLVRGSPWFRVDGGRVFTVGSGGRGLRIWTPSKEAVQLFGGGSVAAVYVIGSRALVTFFGDRKAAVVDLDTGHVVRHSVPARPLLGPGQPIVG